MQRQRYASAAKTSLSVVRGDYRNLTVVSCSENALQWNFLWRVARLCLFMWNQKRKQSKSCHTKQNYRTHCIEKYSWTRKSFGRSSLFSDDRLRFAVARCFADLL